MLTKETVNKLKAENTRELYELIQREDDSTILSVLKNLGRLPTGFSGDYLIPLLRAKDERIRFLTVKNIGKLANDQYLNVISVIAKDDANSKIRREAVSTIGRMRSLKAVPFLRDMTSDRDPKVALQAIRGLLVFKSNPEVREALRNLITHPNEIIQSVIQKEFFSQTSVRGHTPNHTESPGWMKNVVVCGDVLDALRNVPAQSIHLTFTSPPYYNARDYSIYRSYKEYLEFLAEVFREVHRVTKEGRFFLLNTSPVIIPRVSRQHSSKRYPISFDIHPYLIQMGWEFIDDIVWVKPEASVKNRNAGFLQHRKPLGYKPNPITEYVMVYRKKTDKLIDWCMRQYRRDVVEKSKVRGEYETSNVWCIDPTFDKVHSAVFPPELCNRVIEFYSYAGDLVFDPFAGSGTFGKAAVRLGRYFFLTEQEQTYIERMRQEMDMFQNLRFTPRFLNAQEFRNAPRG